MEIYFKKYQQDQLYNYLYVSGRRAEKLSKEKTFDQEDYIKHFQELFELTSFFTKELKLYALLKFSPLLENFKNKYQKVDWVYEVRANDFDGMGVDAGFRRTGEEANGNVVVAIYDLDEITALPEEDLGDSHSPFSLFALQADRKDALHSMLKGRDQPDLPSFLLAEEFFIHFDIGKESGYFTSLLLKTKQDLEEKLLAYHEDSKLNIQQNHDLSLLKTFHERSSEPGGS